MDGRRTFADCCGGGWCWLLAVLLAKLPQIAVLTVAPQNVILSLKHFPSPQLFSIFSARNMDIESMCFCHQYATHGLVNGHFGAGMTKEIPRPTAICSS